MGVMMITMPRSLLHCFDLDLKGKRDSVTQVRFIGFGGISSFPDNFYHWRQSRLSIKRCV